MAYNLRTGLIGSGDIDINVSLSDLTAANITSGVFTVDRIPDMSANKITADTLDAVRIPNISANKITADTLDAARIPNISATKITADTLDTARIPNISANKITSDTLHVDRIPNLDAAKITSGVINTQRIPSIVNGHIDDNSIDSIKIDQASGAFGLGLIPTIPDFKIAVNSIGSSKIKIDTGAFASALIPNIPAAKVAPGEALTNSIDATLLEGVTVLSKKNNQTPATGGGLGCEGDFDCEGHATIEGDLGCEGHLECEGDATFGSTLTDLCKIKGKLITSGGHHHAATYPIMPPGYPSQYGGGGSAPIYYTRKIQIKPTDFMPNDDQSYFNLGVYDAYAIGYAQSGTSAYGAIKTHTSTHEMFAYVSIPDGYKTRSLKIIGFTLTPSTTASNSYVPLTGRNVYAHKVYMDTNVKLQIASGTINSEIIVSATTYDEENFLLIEVATASTSDGIYGGWVEIEPV